MLLGAVGGLVRQDQFSQLEVVIVGHLQQFFGVFEYIGQVDGLPVGSCRRFAMLVHDKTTTDRIKLFCQQCLTLRVQRTEAHAIGMQRQQLVVMKKQIQRLVELRRVFAKYIQTAIRNDPGQGCLDAVGIDKMRLLPLETEHQRAVGAMALAGRRQRSIKLAGDAIDIAEQALVFQIEGKLARRIHRAHRVRTGWPDADLQDVENADAHGVRLYVSPFPATAGWRCRRRPRC
ncbi:hypothetical protein MnTg04_01504 [bacterium MnTg04]|nr:hypothetical protein MnTg04_01504 [bacterium MnTg04]